VGWIADIPKALAAVEGEARSRHRIRGAAAGAALRQAVAAAALADWRQGLTLVHFSAQPEPFLSQNTP